VGLKKKYNIEEISHIVKGELHSNSSQSFIENLLIDSRKIISPTDSLFFALVGKNHNGHNFIECLVKKGVKNFIVSTIAEEYKSYDANFILVKDTLQALQQLTAYHRKCFDIPIIGITGSNGKTIVKEWLFQLLSKDMNVVRSPKSYNSQVGVPLSVWEINEDHDLGIFEAGISEADEMGNLQTIISPTIGIFTNIGLAHNENFIHINQKIGEKLRLFTKVDTLICCFDHYQIKERIFKSEITESISLFTWSVNGNADLTITNINTENKVTHITANYKNNSISITIPFMDAASIENATHCWATMLFLGYDNSVIAERMTQLSTIEMRLELIEGINNCTLINDCYSLDFNSLGIALDFLNQQKQQKKKTVIISDILESGKDFNDLFNEVATLLKEKGINKVIGIGSKIYGTRSEFAKFETEFYKTTDEFFYNYTNSAFNNETILIKGARIFQFERISNLLQQKTHQTTLEINLNAFVNNLNAYKALINEQTKVMAMVKAFSYGSGSFEIANLLQFHRVDYLGVAYTDEGVELRKAGITVPILVMSAEENSFDLMIKHKLEPEIFNIRILKEFYSVLEKKKLPDAEPFPIHLKIDTGMHRLGFEKKDIKEMIDLLKQYPHVYVKSIFSHFAGSDDEELDYFTKEQVSLFKDISEWVISELGYNVIRHISNSAGIVKYPEYQFDMVRLGIGLYGIDMTNEIQNKLQNVSTLKSNIVQIKKITQGESVGYSRKYISTEEITIATIPVGYADGLNRKYGNGNGQVLIKGKLASIIGNICMDMCMVDISNIEEASEGDEVIFFGKEYSITEIAKSLDTIPYEVLTSISRRVKRIYYYE